MISQLHNSINKHNRDILILLLLAVTVWIASYHGAKLVDPIITQKKYRNFYFQSDSSRVFENMTTRMSNHYRTKVHPLFSLIGFAPVYVMKKIFDLRPAVAVRIVMATVSSIWIITFYILLRSIGVRKFDATLFSFLAMTSAAFIFWCVVPETYSSGSLSILLALLIVAISEYRTLSSWFFVIVSSLTMSFTVTNWMAGISATFVNYPWKRALQITVNAFALVTILWGVQKFLFPSTMFFIGDQEEVKYMLTAESGGILKIVPSFFFHSIIMPAINVIDTVNPPDWFIMSTQQSMIGSGSLWGYFSVGLWAVLFILGLWALFRIDSHLRLRLVLVLSIIGQLGLHLIYGEETFLYSLHFTPLLIVVVGLATLTPARRIVLILMSGLVICTGMNNYYQFNETLSILQRQGKERQKVITQMNIRPKDSWPRGEGHVILAIPGSKEEDKAYHEPGGGFSPVVGSFGVSIWITDEKGNLITSSDTISLNDINQRLTWHGDPLSIPGIVTESPHYRAHWSSQGPGSWRLDLNPSRDSKKKCVLFIRSVGPAGGPITSLNWNGKSLLINERWTLKIEPIPTEIIMGDEFIKGVIKGGRNANRWRGKGGWGYARFTLTGNQVSIVSIEDALSPTITNLTYPRVRSNVEIDLPDQDFVSCIDAQVAHIMMSLVGKETRPGDPMNYPLTWLRDGAYVIVALARSGQLDLAKELSSYLAENDFFGGFGAEADGPGLALWALEEVAARIHEFEYDQQLWPHIERKVKLILELLSADSPIYKLSTGPTVPWLKETNNAATPSPSLVAKSTKNGLIIGKMDHHWPLLFVNAVTYRGLIAAASLADRINHDSEAASWRSKAKALKNAWVNGFKPPESLNRRTYICGLWPTGIAGSIKNEFKQNLSERWISQRNSRGEFLKLPLWTYFDVSEAHQWLFLNQPERAWSMLHWFWDHQTSPGLYTWWEGKGEENTSHRWEDVRGWINPAHVTPHYWTAAEMVLLQLDMLAYMDEMEHEPVIIIGEGIPKIWLNHSMRVNRLLLPGSTIDWDWDGKKMKVYNRGKRVDVRLGSPFPADTILSVEYLRSR